MAISAGPLFKLNPSISFHVKCRTLEEVEEIWKKLTEENKMDNDVVLIERIWD